MLASTVDKQLMFQHASWVAGRISASGFGWIIPKKEEENRKRGVTRDGNTQSFILVVAFDSMSIWLGQNGKLYEYQPKDDRFKLWATRDELTIEIVNSMFEGLNAICP